MKDNYCVIMGGGVGSRFWPFSRETYPKQFLDFFGTGKSLLQLTVERFKKIIPEDNIYIVTNEQYAGLMKEQLPELSDKQILLEPSRRNTAPCITYAAYHIKACNPNANIVVASSDHLILKEDVFLEDVQKTIGYFKDIANNPVVGWLVAISGTHFGEDFKLVTGKNFIGRSTEMDVALTGDASVSREKHAIILYEPKGNVFLVQPGDAKELFYLNDNVVLAATEIKAYDVLTLGDTKLLFVPCCSDKFKWDSVKADEKE